MPLFDKEKFPAKVVFMRGKLSPITRIGFVSGLRDENQYKNTIKRFENWIQNKRIGTQSIDFITALIYDRNNQLIKQFDSKGIKVFDKEQGYDIRTKNPQKV